MAKVKVKSYINEDIIVIGNSEHGETFSLRDDYESMDVIIGGQEYRMETDGYCFIAAQSEVPDLQEILADEDLKEYITLVSGFTGDIYVNIVDSKGDSYMSEDALEDDILYCDAMDDFPEDDISTVVLEFAGTYTGFNVSL